MPVTLTLQPPQYRRRRPRLMVMPLAMLWLLAVVQASAAQHSHSIPTDLPSDLQELLTTESALIETLKNYIDTWEQKISIIKRKTQEIKAIHQEASNDTHKYLNNPINALTILKRFTTDWNALLKYSQELESSKGAEDSASKTKSLKFPSEADFDDAVGNLLRIQDIYKLETQRLAVGEIHGIKLGGEMSWSDCLEIGRKSDERGDFKIAKFWIETALGKLPDAANITAQSGADEEIIKARFGVLQELLNVEASIGNFQTSLKIADEMLVLRPRHKGVIKAKQTLEKAKRKKLKNVRKSDQKKRAKQAEKQAHKSARDLLIEEICRAAIDIPSTSFDEHTALSLDSTKQCLLVTGNLPQLLLRPLKLELFNLDPYIVLYHNVFSTKQIDDLRNLIEVTDSEVSDGDLRFTNLAQKKLARITELSLRHVTGHAAYLFGDWKAERQSFEDATEFEPLVTQSIKHKIAANVLFNLQTPKLGGSIVFPQLALSVKVPPESLLYWSNLNEFQEQDYRSIQYVCPVIAGMQTLAVASIKRST